MAEKTIQVQIGNQIFTAELKDNETAAGTWDERIPEGKNDTEIAEEGLSAMEQWMKELCLVINITDLGTNESMISDLVKGTLI